MNFTKKKTAFLIQYLFFQSEYDKIIDETFDLRIKEPNSFVDAHAVFIKPGHPLAPFSSSSSCKLFTYFLTVFIYSSLLLMKSFAIFLISISSIVSYWFQIYSMKKSLILLQGVGYQ